MKDIIEFIEKNIDPVGIEKKNKSSLFSAIGRIFNIVKNDAVTSFNAHFPYLADSTTLRKHGKSLSIPEFPYDTEEGYRERVSTASFFLMRAGERGYICDKIKERFGDQFVLKEEFLKILINLAELTEPDRMWLHSFLDESLDPNIELTISEWFRYIDDMLISEHFYPKVTRKDLDTFAGNFICNGQFYCDHGKDVLCNGSWVCNGSVKAQRFKHIIGNVSPFIYKELYTNGKIICNGNFDCSGYEKIFSFYNLEEPVLLSTEFTQASSTYLSLDYLEDVMRINAVCDGSWLCNGSNIESLVDSYLHISIIKELHSNGLHSPSCSVCNGSIICDGSYSGFDGLYYQGDKLFKEVLI